MPVLVERDVHLPANGWRPRWYQDPLWQYYQEGGTKGICIGHRRWGKDDFALNLACVETHKRIGNYWHLLPEAEQARKAIWNAVDEETGVRRIDQAFPLELREKTRDDQMLIKFRCGSTWQVGGSDNYNSLVGASPLGISFSEYALANPSAYSFLRPILAKNGGWVLFITTPRGRNHAAALYDYAAANPDDWFACKQDALYTEVFDAATLDREKRELIAERGKDDGLAIFEQEYLVSFEAAVVGAIYRSEFIEAEREGRLAYGLFDPSVPVWTAWDLGYADGMVIWFAQVIAGQVRIIDFYINNGKPLAHYCKLVREKPYVYERHVFPKDIEAGEQIAGKKRIDEVRGLLGATPITVLPNAPIWDGINAARRLFARTWFDMGARHNGEDGPTVADGVAALRSYQRRWNDKLKRFEDEPLHNAASDSADGFRYLALGLPLSLSQSRVTDDKYRDRRAGRIVHRGNRRVSGGMAG